MNERASRLHATADQQVGELIDLISTLDEETSHMPCLGRQKLGDGTVAAWARHTADNYQRIAVFVNDTGRKSSAHTTAQQRAHRTSRAFRILGHGPAGAAHGPGVGSRQHNVAYTADNTDLSAMVKQLVSTRDSLLRTAELGGTQLDAIPPAGSFKFCDGNRTVEQVLASVLKHQRHQLDSLHAAIA